MEQKITMASLKERLIQRYEERILQREERILQLESQIQELQNLNREDHNRLLEITFGVDRGVIKL